MGRYFQAATWVVIAIVSIWNIGFFFANLRKLNELPLEDHCMALTYSVDCVPIELNWRPTAGVSGRCADILMLFWAVLISDILTDGEPTFPSFLRYMLMSRGSHYPNIAMATDLEAANVDESKTTS